MTDVQADEGDGTYEQRVLSLMEHAVRDELAVYDGVLGLGLPNEALDTLAWAVATRLASAFDFRWSPDWAKSGPHVWREEDGFRARCQSCLTDSPPQADEEAARQWHAEHQGSQHAA